MGRFQDPHVRETEGRELVAMRLSRMTGIQSTVLNIEEPSDQVVSFPQSIPHHDEQPMEQG